MCHLIFSFSYVGGMDSIKKVIMHANKRRKIPSFFWGGKDGSQQLIYLFNEENKFFITKQITFLNSNTHPRLALGGVRSVAGLGNIFLI